MTTSTSTRIPSTVGRIGLFQVFDYNNGRIPSSQISGVANHYNAVWASVEPGAWKSAHPGMLVSKYFIMGLDQYSVTGHSLSWWKSNHPDWILYACDASGNPTHDIAYMPGIGVPDMPIDIHNPDAVQYQVGTLAAYAAAHDYNALAIDQAVFWNTLQGGNPSFGQTRNANEYGCGVWQGGTFVRRYASPRDRAWTADVVAYAGLAKSIAHAHGLTLIVNHPAGQISDPNEQVLVRNTDVEMDETGFSDYGRYIKDSGALFKRELAFMRYTQQQGTAMLVIDKFANMAHPDRAGFEYSLATYLLGNQGAALLFVGGLHEYGTLQYHSEYGDAIGTPCSDVAGGPQLYWRRFSGGLAVVNAGMTPASFALPSGLSYHDIEGRSVGSTLSMQPNDAYVLLGGHC